MRGAAVGGTIFSLLLPLAALGQPAPSPEAASAAVQAAPVIQLVYMGGNDCPSCRAWHAVEWPRLQASPVFKRIRFSTVIKGVGATVPSSFFLPDDVKPLKEKLDRACNGRTGSPQTAVFVDGELRDYYWGTRSAADIERMVRALERGKPYPFTACLKLTPKGTGCAEPVLAQATSP